MGELVCPHCHGNVSFGAKVCRGCQAEVEYGAPRWALLIVLAFAAIFGLKTGLGIAEWLGWVVGIAALFGGAFAANVLFKNRINFKRMYRTK